MTVSIFSLSLSLSFSPSPLHCQVIGSLIALMDDANIQVKDSAAWTLGRVCEHVPEVVLNEQYLLPLLKALVGGLKGEPRVATNVCWVSLFCGFYKSIILCIIFI